MPAQLTNIVAFDDSLPGPVFDNAMVEKRAVAGRAPGT